MANQNNPQISARKDTVTKIFDVNGDTILEISMHEYTLKHSNGSRSHHRIHETIQLQDGTVWTPAAMAKIPVGVCEQCRQALFSHRKIHGLVAMHKAKLCVDGGELCCPLHRKLGKDNKWRCLKHHRQHLLKTLLAPIFFERVD